MKTFLPQEWENVRSDETKPSVNKAQDINTQTSSSNNNDEDTRLKVERVVNLIEQSKVDITIGYDAWLKIGILLFLTSFKRQEGSSSIVSADKTESMTNVRQTNNMTSVFRQKEAVSPLLLSSNWQKMPV